MQNITLILAVGILTEALIEYAREIKNQPILAASIAIGIALTFLFNIRLFEFLGMTTNPYADQILTGIIASRGSNYIYDLVGKLTTKTE